MSDNFNNLYCLSCQHCFKCYDCSLCIDCVNCEECFMCIGCKDLRSNSNYKLKYYVFNVEFTENIFHAFLKFWSKLLDEERDFILHAKGIL